MAAPIRVRSAARRLALAALCGAWLAPAEGVAAPGPPLGFNDVPPGHWATEGVRYVAVEHAYMRGFRGLLGQSFGGQATLDRLSFAFALVPIMADLERLSRASWAAEIQGSHRFADVPQAAADALDRLANRYGCFDGLPGVTDTRLSPARPLTRAEMALAMYVLLARAEALGLVQVEAHPEPSPFRDLGAEPRAAEAITALAVHFQVLDGSPDGTFRPRRTLNRYEFAAAVTRIVTRVRRLIARAASPTPENSPGAVVSEPTASPEPLMLPPLPTPRPIRYLEETPLQAGLSVGDAGLLGRGVAYVGPLYGQADLTLHGGAGVGSPFQVAGLRLGSGVRLGERLALQPFAAATGYTNLAQHAVLAGGGLLAQWRQAARLDLTATGQVALPLWTNASGLLNVVFLDAGLGAQYHIGTGMALTLDLGYGIVPAPTPTLLLASPAPTWRGLAGLAFTL